MKHIFCIAVIIVLILTGCSMNRNKKTVNEQEINTETTASIPADTPEPIVTDTPWDETSYYRETRCYSNDAVFDEELLDGMMKGSYRPKNYEKLFTGETFAEYRHDELSEWKDENGNYCYPKDYSIGYAPSDPLRLASQQFPKELLQQLDTEELLDFILECPDTLSLNLYNWTLLALSYYRSDFNFIDELMSRTDCQEVVEKKYYTYSEKERKEYTGADHSSGGEDFKECNRFQLVEALKWYFMKQNGEELPDEDTYCIDLDIEPVESGPKIICNSSSIYSLYHYRVDAMFDKEQLEGMSKGIYRPKNYQKFFDEEKYANYLFDDISEWKDEKGNLRYPIAYKAGYDYTSAIALAKQQFPQELLKQLSTKDLFQFILKYPGEWNIISFEQALDALSMYRSDYNFIDELMNRKDCQQVVETYYGKYSKKQIKMYSRLCCLEGYNGRKKGEPENLQKFWLVEALNWYFMKQDGKKLPKEISYYFERDFSPTVVENTNH